MKSVHKWKVFFLLLPMIAVASPAHADSVWNVNGTLSSIGNSVCSGLCIETLSFSFQFQWVPLLPNLPVYRAAVVPGTMSVNSFGPLGVFTGFDFHSDQAYIPFSNAANDQLEFRVRHDTNHDYQTDPNAPPIFFGPDLYGCGTVTCMTDFVPPNNPFYGRTPPVGALFLPATLDYSLIQVPEPPAGLLLLCGLCSCYGIWHYRPSKLHGQLHHLLVKIRLRDVRSSCADKVKRCLSTNSSHRRSYQKAATHEQSQGVDVSLGFILADSRSIFLKQVLANKNRGAIDGPFSEPCAQAFGV